MSTYLYLECLNHNPPLSSDGEVGQHLYDLAQIRKDVANRSLFLANACADMDADYGHHFRNNTARVLCAHPNCWIGIRDEYGREHPLEEVTPLEGCT